ncbi:hypothetical protein DS2_05320 [Catenovulum agarivorans DS-2]|uniref:Prephenate dehydrogenase n=1 Tax=Catenovulum agarivorans DS-2 TaxID=1328313 RepID=W7QHB0_9ALTE|nr:hypothetical protein [Catenovulum agarivorans]EWH11251.1 hypothetical protein DS2_05320 [Catenovulum agarivorans DS-2]
MLNILENIRQNLALAYEKAQECDQILDQLQQNGQGKFSAIFTDGFVTQATRFKPYVEEIAQDFYPYTQLSEAQQQQIEPQVLAAIVVKLEKVFSTQAKFQQSVSEAE